MYNLALLPYNMPHLISTSCTRCVVTHLDSAPDTARFKFDPPLFSSPDPNDAPYTLGLKARSMSEDIEKKT